MRAPATRPSPSEGLSPNSVSSELLSSPETGLGNPWLLRSCYPCRVPTPSTADLPPPPTPRRNHFLHVPLGLSQMPFHEAFLSPPTNEASILYKDLLHRRVVLGGTGMSQIVMAGRLAYQAIRANMGRQGLVRKHHSLQKGKMTWAWACL